MSAIYSDYDFAGRMVFSLESWEKGSVVRISYMFMRGFAGRVLPRTIVPANPFKYRQERFRKL